MRRDAMHARGAADPHRSAAHLTSLTALEARARGHTYSAMLVRCSPLVSSGAKTPRLVQPAAPPSQLSSLRIAGLVA